MQACAGPRGVARQSGYCAGLCRPEGAAQWNADCACLDPGLSGLRGAGWQSGNRAGLCRPEGHGLAEIVNVCGSSAWQALRAQSNGYSASLRSESLG
jgi:hypothetical protein